MESYDERRRRDEERRRAQARDEESGRHRDTWWRRGPQHEDDHQRRAERGSLDYDRDYGRDYGGSDERQSRHGHQSYDERGDRQRFSPDWSREGAQPRYSDDPYYSRNRDRNDEPSRSGRGDYHDPDSPYDRGAQDRDAERSRGERQQHSGRDDEGSHYRGWYSRSG